MQLRSLVRRNVLGWRGRYHSWLRDQGEVSLCVLLTHSMARTRAAVGRRLFTSNECSEIEQSGTPPAAGWWIHGVAGIRCVKRATPQLERIRNQHAGVEGRPRHGAAGGVSGGCDRWDVRIPLPPSLSDLAACKPHGTQRRCLALLPWWVDHPLARSRHDGWQQCV